MNKSRSKKRREEQDPDEEDERVLFFIPSAGIIIDVLVWYLKQFLGHDSDAEPGTHPREADVDGYFVRSRLGLSTVMVEDLKEDSREWRAEKKRTRTRKAYSESATAASRLDTGASGSPTVPKKTQDLAAARRAEASQPPGQGIPQLNPTQSSATRHNPQDANMQSGSYSAGYFSGDTSQRHDATYQGSGQQPGFSYASPPLGQTRPSPAAINLNVNMASYQQASGRHQSPSLPNVMPSIEGRSGYYSSPAPPYEEGDGKGDQPSTTGSHGFPNINPTAGARHNRPSGR